MQRLSGVLMVLAGTALGGYMVLPAPQNGAGRLAEGIRILASTDRAAPQIISGANAAPPAAESAKSAAAPSPAVPAAPVATADDVSGVRVFSPATPLVQPAAGTWTAVVTSEPTAKGKMTSSKPGDAETRAALASDLQRELKRVGCYGGDITGSWTTSSKRAMAAFMERVNATLPVEEPDYILLTLVQGHAATACGAECPTGQVQSSAGRCVPQAVVAQATRKTQREEERRANEDRKAQQQERLAVEQRAADAARLAEVRKAAEKAAEAERVAAIVPPAPKPAVRPQPQAQPQAAKPQQTAAVEPEKLPWLATDTVTAKPSEVAVRTEPLPGMMSVGGPRPVTPEVPASAALTPNRGPRPAVVIEDLLDSKPAAAAPVAPAVQARQAPVVRQAAISGLPGTKSGVAANRSVVRSAAVAGLPGSKSGVAVQHSVVHSPPPAAYKYRPAKIVRRPPPVVVYSPPKPKAYYYASSSGGKTRRGQPRPGTMHFNVMQSLGGIY